MSELDCQGVEAMLIDWQGGFLGIHTALLINGNNSFIILVKVVFDHRDSLRHLYGNLEIFVRKK